MIILNLEPGFGEQENLKEIPKVLNSANRSLYEKLKLKAQEMRRNPTPAERVLWEKLKENIVIDNEIFKFRRQHIIGHYIADFYCVGASLIIELDGEIHKSQEEQDHLRQESLEFLGCRVIRFPNGIVLNKLDYVVEQIKNSLILLKDS